MLYSATIMPVDMGDLSADLANQIEQLDLLLAQELSGAGGDVILPEGFFSNEATASDVPGPDDPLNALNSESEDQNSADSQSIVQALETLQPLESQAITEPGSITEFDRYQIDWPITTGSLSVESGVDTHWKKRLVQASMTRRPAIFRMSFTTLKRGYSIA